MNGGRDFDEELRDAIIARASFIGPRFDQLPTALERAIHLGTHYVGGGNPDGSADLNGQLIQRVQAWTSEVAGGPTHSAAFMDATTLLSVDTVVSDKYLPHPELLYDLATFVEGAVLFDRIFHLGNPRLPKNIAFKFNEAMGGDPLVVALPMDWEDSSALAPYLAGIWREVGDYFDQLNAPGQSDLVPEMAREIRASWEILLGTELPDTKELFAYLDSHWESPAKDLLLQAIGALAPEPNTYGYFPKQHLRAAYRLANESNQRSLFNLRVSDELGLPYLQSWGRVPFRNSYQARSFRAQKFLTTADFLDATFRSRADIFMKSRTRLQLPFLLSAVLARISNLSEFFEEVAEVRSKTTEFRKRRRELDDALAQGNLKVIDKLRAALVAESERVLGFYPKTAIAAISGMVVACGAAQLGLGGTDSLALPALLYAATHGIVHFLVDDTIVAISERILRPEYSVITDIGQSADTLTNALPKIGKLWKVSDGSQADFAERFMRLKMLA